ncbi:hypothetical protein [Priestia filamentosa]|uniref:hypothetical protein n=1 Tax=Priestia filamentosa TaxID=1402861 RepID=UPI0039789B89
MGRKVNCNLGIEDSQKLDEVMERLENQSISKVHLSDGLRECIRFTWKNDGKLEWLESENSKLNDMYIKQQKELIEKDSIIEEILNILQKR